MQYLRINNNYVDQSEIRISKNKLITSHLGTCSAILFSLNNNNLLGHIDAIYNNEEQLIEKIKNNFNIKELKKINIPKNKLLIWEKYLNSSISDMTKGEKAALYWDPDSQITFYVKERLKKIIKDKEFADAYINIWLGENTSRPILRDKIIGLKK